MTSPGSTTKPRGREQVRSAVLTATSALVAERGPDGFSVREIAARAGVNHALVHRHFGTKADVLEQMLAADAEAVVAAVVESGLPTSGQAGGEVVAELLDLLAERPSYWRTLVHAVLDSPEAALPGTASTTELFSGLWRGATPRGRRPRGAHVRRRDDRAGLADLRPVHDRCDRCRSRGGASGGRRAGGGADLDAGVTASPVRSN